MIAGGFQEQRIEVITAVIPAPFGFLERARELVGADTALFGQPTFGKAPKGFDAVDVPLASGKFIFMVMHAMMFEPVPHEPVSRPSAVGEKRMVVAMTWP